MAPRAAALVAAASRRVRKERAALPEPVSMPLAVSPAPPGREGPPSSAAEPVEPRRQTPDGSGGRRIRTFDSELDPFRFGRLDSGDFVLFRWAWRDGARSVQGALIDGESFLAGLVIDGCPDRTVRADPDAVTQILINLVDNAIKLSARAERRRIEIGCEAGRRGRVALRVRDYGPGIPKSERKRVFRLFHRLENEATRETKGTGIGLALVARLAKAMDGGIELIGREPGVEVRVWLRVVDRPRLGA